MNDDTPVIVGVGEASERIDAPDYAALSPVALAGAAAKAALQDTGVDWAAVRIDVVAAIRQFEISTPAARPPFGASDNFPRSVARRIGADPARAIWEPTGGQGPQHLVNEFAHAIAKREAELVLLVGSEAISTVRHLMGKGETRDWKEEVGGQIEDRGYGVSGLLDKVLIAHGVRTPIQAYALFENARRARRHKNRDAYRQEMAQLFAPFTRVAHDNPHAMSRDIHTVAELATVTERNRLTSDPFPRWLVARDQANQGAAVLLTSVRKARELGIAEDRWIYLWGGADVKERPPLERQDLSRGPASVAAVKQALDAAGMTLGDVNRFDLYSCFPIAVFNICDGMGLAPDDPRGLTVTGGLPYFGGAGNNYSMHAIAAMVNRLRARPGSIGLVAANGGFLSKYSVGIYAAAARDFQPFDSSALQAEVNGWTAPVLDQAYAGQAAVETYTIDYSGKAPRGVVIARTPAGARVVAMTPPDDMAVVEDMIANDPLGRQVMLKPGVEGLVTVAGFSI